MASCFRQPFLLMLLQCFGIERGSRFAFGVVGVWKRRDRGHNVDSEMRTLRGPAVGAEEEQFSNCVPLKMVYFWASSRLRSYRFFPLSSPNGNVLRIFVPRFPLLVTPS